MGKSKEFTWTIVIRQTVEHQYVKDDLILQLDLKWNKNLIQKESSECSQPNKENVMWPIQLRYIYTAE